jgi:hypothetical protein
MRKRVVIVLSLIVGVVLCLVVGAGLFLKDDPAPQINYTFLDLEVPAEVAASRPVLLRYTDGGTNSIEIALCDEILGLAGQSTNLLPYAEAIESAWSLCTEGRSYVDELNQFPGITDWDNPDELPNMVDYEVLDLQTHGKLCQLYVLYAKVLAQQGETREGIEVLSGQYTMARKGLPYSTTIFTRMTFIMMAGLDIEAAAQILQTEDLSQEELELMKKTFSPLNYEELSMFRPILSEYLLSQSLPRDAFTTFEDFELYNYKPNRTITLFKRLYEPMLDLAKDEESYSPQAALRASEAQGLYLDKLLSKSGFSNNMGRMFLDIYFPNATKEMVLAVLKPQAESDLLALEIERRLGGTLDLKDPFSGEAYLYDEERGAYFGVGEDGQPGTEDDVYVGER